MLVCRLWLGCRQCLFDHIFERRKLKALVASASSKIRWQHRSRLVYWNSATILIRFIRVMMKMIGY